MPVQIKFHPSRWRAKGPSIKYVTLFWPILTPPPVTLCHTSRDPLKVRHTSRTTPPIFSRPSTKTQTKAPCTNSLSIVRRGFCPGGFVRGVFCLEDFVWGGFCPFPLLSEYICYNRNLMYHICMIKNYKCDVTCS